MPGVMLKDYGLLGTGHGFLALYRHFYKRVGDTLR